MMTGTEINYHIMCVDTEFRLISKLKYFIRHLAVFLYNLILEELSVCSQHGS